MNTSHITSCIVREYLSRCGHLTALQTIPGDRPDETVHVFCAYGRDGTYVSDNAGVTWFDADFERVVAALQAGDTSHLTSGSVSKI